MPNIRRTFVKGVMNKDVDERLLDDGYFRHAENVVINTSEGSDVGAIEKCLSNKQLTFLDLGANINVVGAYSDEAKKKLYWWVVSSFNKYVFEYDLSTKAVYKLLHESRLKNEDFILKFRKNTQITGIGKILSEDIKKDMLVWTDNVGEICSINIERAKTYGKNGFTKEDIYLIKKPPTKAPVSNLIYIKTDSNNIEERFISFAYRYKYLDGEYSALSPFSNYNFEPKGVDIDYDTQENNGMINRYNGVQVMYNSGGKQVKEIQVIAKESRSNNCYIIETFNKKKLSITDDSEQSIIYSNNKLYKVLPEKELFKEFDNVPRKAKSLAIVGNRLVFGNYTEGYHMVDSTGVDIKPDFNVSVKSYDIGNTIVEGGVADYNNKYLVIRDSKTLYKQGYSMNLLMTIINDSGGSASQDKTMIDTEFFYNFKKDYTTLKDLITDLDFIDFVSYMNDYIARNIINYKDYETTSALKTPVTIEAKYDDVERELFFEVKYGWIYFTDEEGAEWGTNLYARFSNNSNIKLNAVGSFKSVKSNRDYEVAIVYEDEFKRSSTAITCLNNSTHIGIEKAVKVNKLEVAINHKPPTWAKTYRLAVKATENTYETIYISVYFPYEGYVYCKLEGTSKDKVKEGDTLILKKDSNKEASSVLTVKVLERAWKDKDFLKGNKDQSGNDIVEPEGIYIKIKPTGFVMDESKFNTVSENSAANSRSSSIRVGNNDYARIRTRSFSESDGSPLKLNQGSVVQVWIKSAHCPDKGWQENILNKTYHINKPNYDFQKWYDDEIKNKPQLWGNEGNSTDDYKPFIGMKDNVMTIISTKRHLSGNRASYLDVSIVVRQNNGIYIFETQEEKKVDTGIFHKTSQVFHIVNGRHSGENPNMPIVSDKIKLELDFHNCYSFGNSVESYKIKDNFNANSLGIDLQATATSEDDYAEITRYSDLTFSEAFIESTGFNGINSFNRSLLNWKELDKGNGWVQKIVSRDGNLLVFQTEKVGQVMFGKDVMYGADGTANVTKVPYILGEYIAYSGEYGMSHPESFEMEGNRAYWIDAKRGHVLRLSNNGISPITYGMEGFFRDELSSKSDWKILGGYDPYTKLYNITFFERNQLLYVFDSNTEIIKFKETEVFKYDLGLGKLNGEAKLQYHITDGRATIEAIVNGRRYVESNVSGVGELVIAMEKVSAQDLLLETTITPVTDEVSYTIKNMAPQGTDIGITIIVLSEESVYDVSALVGFKWGDDGQYYYNDVSLDTKTTNLFLTEIGKQGIGKFIGKNALLKMTTKSDKRYNYDKDHVRMRYLSSDVEYNENQISEILDKSMEVYLTDEKESDVNVQTSGVIESRPEKFKYLIFDFKKTDIESNKLLPPASAKVLSAVENIANIQIIYGNNQKEVVSYNIRYRSKYYDEWLDYFVVEKTKEESVTREFKLKIPAEDALFMVASVDREGLMSEYINFE